VAVPETARERPRRRVYLAYGGNAVVFVIWFLAMTYVVHPPGWLKERSYSLTPHESVIEALWCLLPIVIAGAWLYALTRARCPRCAQPFRFQFVLRTGFGRPGTEPKVCPSCGLPVDDPLP
jgi:hypothetical protein